ncbi:hypothetical protein F4777DRAFT_583950 [Nemania sp. FL0916]|nr:hypothetical protein F4777DRAFT_583950 [Nemania sp. FL0916]
MKLGLAFSLLRAVGIIAAPLPDSDIDDIIVYHASGYTPSCEHSRSKFLVQSCGSNIIAGKWNKKLQEARLERGALEALSFYLPSLAR